MKDFNEHIDFLILQYFKGTISPGETEELMDWVEKTVENKRFFKEQLTVLRNLQAPSVQFNAEKGLSEIHSQIHKTPKYALTKKITAIAASVVFVLLIGLVTSRYLTETKPEMIVFSAQENNLEKRLEDNTRISLCKYSVLTKAKQFQNKSRDVELRGKAFFEVSKKTNRPFVIHCGNIDVTVLGTSFEVDMDSMSHQVKVTVSKGLVSVRDKNSGFKKDVAAGMQITVSQNGDLISEAIIKNKNYLAWKTRILEFDNTPMTEVREELMKMYKKEIIFRDKELENEYITTKIDNQSISEIKILLETILNAKLEERGDSLILTKN